MMEDYSKKGFKLPKEDLNILIQVLKEYGKIKAPVKSEKWLRMQEEEDPDKMSLEGLSWYSSKKEVFPQKQTIFEFEGNKITTPDARDVEEKVLFGLRLCDLNSFMINDKLFLEQNPANVNYKNNREKLTLVGLWCDKQVDNYCFCSSMNLAHYYDVCLFEREFDNQKYFHVKTNSKKGEVIMFKVNQIKILELEEFEAKTPECRNQLMETDIKRFHSRNDVWDKEAEKCLSCGDCTSLCPTCLCFDMQDDLNLDLKSGVRIAKWDSCMFKDFSLVAGGHYFRESRTERLKHRIYHKMQYFPEKFDGQKMCTGCGRCIRGCPTKIHWVAGINGMVLSEKQNGGNKE